MPYKDKAKKVQRQRERRMKSLEAPIEAPKSLKLQGLQTLIHTIEDRKVEQVTQGFIPFYNSDFHTTGDTVRMRDNRGRIEVVTL